MAVIVNTVPYCGQCGWEPYSLAGSIRDTFRDLLCDSCGADLLEYGFTEGLIPPEDLVVTADDPTWGQATATFTENATADTMDLRYRLDNGPWVVVTGVTTPEVLDIGAGVGQKIDVQLRSIHLGVDGPWGTIGSDVFAVQATGATAGIPGAWTPSGSRPPADLAETISLGIVADPLTLWTVGQSVVTIDTNDAHWDSAAWILGVAPA